MGKFRGKNYERNNKREFIEKFEFTELNENWA